MTEDQHMNSFRSEIYRLGELFGRKVSEGAVTQFWGALHDLTWEQFQRGMRLVESEGEAFPRPIDLRRLVVGDPDQQRREREEKAQRDREHEEFVAWKADPVRQARDRARLNRLIDHQKGDHKAEPLEGCGSCRFEERHTAPHLHLRGGVFASEVNWDFVVDGCCK